MDKRVLRLLVLPLLLLCCGPFIHAADSRFDLVGPKIDVRVTRNGQTLPIASVPNLQPGDRLWIHPDLPASQSVKYLLICVFLRGNTNPPPESWFYRIETWEPKIREEGTFVTVPAEAQQAVMFMAPETGGDFSTLKSAVRGRPGAFVRASQDLIEAGFEEARIEKYIASIRRVPAADPEELQKHSDLLARTLALKPNEACFKQPIDMQFTCLTQTGSQIVLDDGNGQTISNVLNGPTSDLIAQASYTGAAGAGAYSAYVGAVVDVVRIMSNLHTAQYQYIPAISFPQDDAMNLRLNTPPSFHNPKSVLVIALPSVQPAVTPPLRPADANEVTCLIKPSVVLPIEGAPLVFSTDFAHNMYLQLETPPGAPPEADIPLIPDAYFGGLVLQKVQQHHILLNDPTPLQPAAAANASANPAPVTPNKNQPPARPQPEPILVSGVIKGRWGFDSFTGPTVKLQQLPGSGWSIVAGSGDSTAPIYNLIAGHSAMLQLTSTGSACVHTITAHPDGEPQLTVPFKHTPKPDQPNLLALTLPLEHDRKPGNLHLAIQQYDQPKVDEVSARTFSEPATVTSVEIHAGDRSLVLNGTRLGEIESVTLGDLVFSPVSDSTYDSQPADASLPGSLQFALPANVPAPSTHVNENLTANISLRDGRQLSLPVTVSTPRPSIVLLRQSTIAAANKSDIILTNPDDLPLSSLLTFTLKSSTPFPRNGQVEIETLDGTLRTVLTLAPSGGLLLQDPHTVVATLDPLRSFGPSAFGALRMRAIFPAEPHRRNGHNSQITSSETADGNQIVAQTGTASQAAYLPNDTDTDDDTASPASDWLPLVTLVRLPTITQLQCPSEFSQPCTLNGFNFFLLQQISTTPDFANPEAVPDGYTGTSLTIPHPSAGTIFFKLRDDPSSIDSIIMPVPAPRIHTHVKQQPSQPETPDTTPPAADVPPSTDAPAAAPSPKQSPAPSAVPPTKQSPPPSAPATPTTTPTPPPAGY